MAKKVTILVLVLAIVAVLAVLTVMNYSGKTPMPQANTGQAPSSSTSTNSDSSVNTQAQLATYPPVDLNALHDSFPTATSTQAEQTAFSQKISDMAVDVTTLNIVDCAGQPPVMKIKIGVPFTIQNSDSVQHTITHANVVITTIPANTSQQVTPDFKDGGSYGYRCDTKFAGVFFANK